MLICVALTTTMLMLVSSAQFSALTGATTVTTPAASLARLVITTPATPAQVEQVVALLSGAIALKGAGLRASERLTDAAVPAWVQAQMDTMQRALDGAPVDAQLARMVRGALEVCGVAAHVSAAVAS
jgi:hypothetical protein